MLCALCFSCGIVADVVPSFNNDLRSQIAQPTSLQCHSSERGPFLHTDRCAVSARFRVYGRHGII